MTRFPSRLIPSAARPGELARRRRLAGRRVAGCLLVLALSAAGAQAAVDVNVDVVPIPAGHFLYQAAGEFLENGYPANPPRIEGHVPEGRVIMRRLVSQQAYAQCVQANACKPLDKRFRLLDAADRPAVGISWQDATDYAAWLSHTTGDAWRLPTYVEWVRAAADRYREEGPLPSDPDDPSVRWLAEYDRETTRSRGRIKAPQPFGHFGTNALGLQDMAGNVWEWTDTCFMRYRLGTGAVLPTREDCGVRVLGGAHVAAMPDFIRDPRTGACSIGLPPANLGFRLVREDSQQSRPPRH